MRVAVEARIPPVAADGWRRDPVWRDGLSLIIDRLDTAVLPPAAATVIASVRRRSADETEALADALLRGSLDPSDAGAAFWIAAALQVYFTCLAARLPAAALRLLEQRGLCPCCGSTPSAGVVRASGQTPGARYLYCSLCSTAWHHTRAVCITCGGSRTLALRGIGGDAGVVKAETCDECRTYAKVLYEAKDTGVDAYADDLASGARRHGLRSRLGATRAKPAAAGRLGQAARLFFEICGPSDGMLCSPGAQSSSCPAPFPA